MPLDDLGHGALFENVAFRAQVHRGVEEVFFAVHRQKDHFDRQARFLNFSARRRSRPASACRCRGRRCAGCNCSDLRERRFAVAGFGDDFELRVAFDDLPQPLPDDRVIVGDHDADFIGHCFAHHPAKSISMLIVVPCPGAD